MLERDTVALTGSLHRSNLLDNGVPEDHGGNLTEFSISRHFKILMQAAFAEWMASDLSNFDLVATQMDGLHLTGDTVMVEAVEIDDDGNKSTLSGWPRVQRECRDRTGTSGQLDRTRACNGKDPPVHLRKDRGSELGSEEHLRRRCGDPEVPSSQRPQHHQETSEEAPHDGEELAEAGMDQANISPE